VLAAGRTNIVWGRGNSVAPLLLIGEAPGEDEDREGSPFVGRSGQLLNEALSVVGLTEDQFYIVNTVKCRPPGNRNPSRTEMGACFPFLVSQMYRKQVFVFLGKIAAEYLLQRQVRITKENGYIEQLPGGALGVLAFHPAYVLRNRSPETKAAFFQAIRTAKEIAYGCDSQSGGTL
jgi:DNA polymerase